MIGQVVAIGVPYLGKYRIGFEEKYIHLRCLDRLENFM